MSLAAKKAAEACAERAEGTLGWWEGQARAIEEDRTRVKQILPYGLLLSLILFPISLRVSLLTAGITCLATLQGLYLVTVHRWEYAHNIVEAKKDVWRTRNRVLAEEPTRPQTQFSRSRTQIPLRGSPFAPRTIEIHSERLP